ncbi:hypothetical protein; putative exported protein [Herminiimonas arsenicoxydans]|uniref:Uncharacterized protein n=1 Tax=Herminiimonas arsenicoxydans TaxID=204773 RepID=A4G2E7_HERAR|nr:hypothetical protein; putative exported protein [Herminiimonas arsenicoxydans]
MTEISCLFLRFKVWRVLVLKILIKSKTKNMGLRYLLAAALIFCVVSSLQSCVEIAVNLQKPVPEKKSISQLQSHPQLANIPTGVCPEFPRRGNFPTPQT